MIKYSKEYCEAIQKALEAIAVKAILDDRLDPDEILKICRRALCYEEKK